MEKIYKNNSLIEKVVLGILLIMSLVLCILQIFDHDEFEALHTSWKIMKGQTIYVDFFQQKPPFFHITFIPIIKLFSESIRTIYISKIYCYFMFLTILYSTYLIAKNVFSDRIKYLSVAILLSCTFFTDKLTEIRPDTMYIMLIMLAVVFLYRNATLTKKDIIYCAILSGLSFVVLPKAIFYIFIIFFILCIRFYYKQISFKDLILYFIITIVTMIPFFLYLFRTITFEDYWFFNFVINFKFLGGFSPINNFILLFKQNGIFMIIAIIGLFFLKDRRQREIGIFATLLFLSVFTINVPNKQYFVPAMPFFAIIAANYIAQVQLFNKNSSIILLIIIINPIIFFAHQINYLKVSNQIELINLVLKNTNENDKVLDGSIIFNIFRDDIDYFWFSIRPKGVKDTYLMLRPREFNLKDSIYKYKPKVIFTRRLYSDAELTEYINENYVILYPHRNIYIRREYNEQ